MLFSYINLLNVIFLLFTTSNCDSIFQISAAHNRNMTTQVENSTNNAGNTTFPIIINTWPFKEAAQKGKL